MFTILSERSATHGTREEGAALPPYLRKKGRNGTEYAYVRLNDQQVMLGHYGTPGNHQEYTRVFEEWRASPRRFLAASSCEITSRSSTASGYIFLGLPQ